MIAVCLALIDEEEDKKNFEKIYNSLERKLFAFSMNILQNEALSEEAVSETFLSLAKCFKKIHNFSSAEITAYTVIINRNLCFDILKKEKKNNFAVPYDESISNVSDNSFEDDFQRYIVAEAVKQLPEILRDVVMLKYFYGFSVKEISSQLKVSAGTVKYRLETARSLLKKELNQDE